MLFPSTIEQEYSVNIFPRYSPVVFTSLPIAIDSLIFSTAGMEVADESKGNSSDSLGVAKKSDTDSFGKPEKNIQDDAGPEHKGEISDKVYLVLSAPAVCSNDDAMASGSDAAPESDSKSPSKENMEIKHQSTKEPVEPACRLKRNFPSGAATDLQMENTDASQDLLENHSPVSLSTVCDAAEDSTVRNSEGNPTVAEVQRTLQTSEDTLPEPVIEEGGGQVELRPSPLQEDSLQNSPEKSSTPESDSLPAPSTDEDTAIRFNSDLNQPIEGEVESEPHTLSRTVSDPEATKPDSDTNPQNEEDAKNELSVASESVDSGNQVHTRGDDNTCELNVLGNTEGTSVEPIQETSAKMPQLLAAADGEMEKCQNSVPSATCNGTSESLISCSPDLNQQTNTVEAESRETPETISDEVVAEAKPTLAQPDDGLSNSDDNGKPNAADNSQVELVLDSVPIDPYQNRAEVTVAAEAEPMAAQPQPDDGSTNSDDSHKPNAADSSQVQLVLDSVPIDPYQNGAEITVPSSDHPEEKSN